jgi:phosphoribosyl 1,2-cyclic phosphodiesterase
MARIITFSIQSGSNGNCIYVEAGDRRLLFDAGVSGRVVRQRMAEHGRDPADCDALIISHDHSDHVRGAGVFQRMFGLPVYLTRRTRAAIRGDLGRLDDVRYFATGDTLELGAVRVHTASTPHDAADGAVFVVEYAGARLGIFTDLGHVFCGLDGLLDSVDAAYLESNYDVDMLLDGPYPYYLKRRITGHGGHLSNLDAAQLVRGAVRGRHQWIALAHLSGENNHPDLALDTHRAVVGRTLPCWVSPRDRVSAEYAVA